MRHSGLFGIGVLGMLLALLAGACRLPLRDGPVPQSLADCRRLAQQGVAALERDDQTKAENLLAQAVAACPVDAEARRHYAEALWRRGARLEAIAQLEEAGRLMDEDASLWARLAEMRLAAGQPDLALKNVQRALNLNPQLPSAWAIRGGLHRAAGQPQEALADYLRAIGYAPHDRMLMAEIADLHAQLNQPEQSLQTLQSLAETYSPGEEPSEVLYRLGLAYVAVGRPRDGAECLAQAAARGGPSSEIYFRLGEAELLAGRPAEAADAARRALVLEPRHQPSQELLQRIELARQPQSIYR